MEEYILRYKLHVIYVHMYMPSMPYYMLKITFPQKHLPTFANLLYSVTHSILQSLHICWNCNYRQLKKSTILRILL